MKKILLLCTWCTLATLFSCEREEEISISDTELVEFKGLKVPSIAGVPVEILNYEEADYKNMFDAQLKGARTSGEYTISLDEFSAYASPIVAKYPNRTNLSDKAMVEKVQKDFKHLSEKEIDGQLTNILDYYSKIATYEFLKALPRVPKGSKNGRTTYLSWPDINSCEFWLLAQHLSKESAVRWSKTTAENWAAEDYPGTLGLGTGDAFRHSLWNAILIQKLSDENYETNMSLIFTKELTTRHECEEPAGPNTEMDLHNNHVGWLAYPTLTTWSYHWTGCGFLCWGRIPIFNNPGYNNIRQHFRNLANNSVQVSTVSEIQSTNFQTLVRLL